MFTCTVNCPKGKILQCCWFCQEQSTCEDVCTQEPKSCGISVPYTDENRMDIFQKGSADIVSALATIVLTRKQLEEKENQLKADLQAAMERFNVVKFENELIKAVYVAPTIATSIDSAKVKKEYPEIYAKCTKTSSRKAYVKLEVK